MRVFSILQQAQVVEWEFGGKKYQQLVEFSEDPCDSSQVRMRVTPPNDNETPLPEDATAFEVTFDRNGRTRHSRQWSMKYPPWDQRTPEEIDAARAKAEAEYQAQQAAAEEAAQQAAADAMKEAPNANAGKSGGAKKK